MADNKKRDYAHPEVLVTTNWVLEHLNSPGVRIIESNEDQLLYPSGHIPNAVQIDWSRDLNDPIRRDYLDKAKFEELMSWIGATPATTMIFYGDKNNWWATYAFWIFQLFGHTQSKVMDGGRLKWTRENKPMTREISHFVSGHYQAKERDERNIRAFRDQVLKHIDSGLPLVDVRSPEEYRGERLHMEGYPNEGALRGGHIPHAVNVPWSRAANTEDGTFKSFDELRKIYVEEQKLQTDDDVITYCRIGERSSHTWFVLKYLLGFNKVRNYDGSWTEWGNLVNVPIER